ncbi:response regulator [Saccharophagus degradans]|uniref:Response regulator n=1 Tax=Saccharophagus degradans TaxID=86304 RepID=A0AAW7X344_9GAMM|nr:response regulator [Saccharophagus degradans]MBU2983829.1 response regulator [Saccharophagus degradans]MDO6422196.1 response regulator [Saccharophagus degradans]MDO6607529.1 response regulator [Saccharophagus degradans]
MHRILVVEDSPIVRKIINHVMAGFPQFKPVYTTTLAETKALLESEAESIFAALVDLSLPDAPDGEVVDYVLNNHIPTIVLTGSFDTERREQLLAKGIVDYVTKEGRYSYQYALGVLARLVKNQKIKVMVVDDSATARNFVVGLLRLHLFEVYDADDGAEAIRVFIDNPDIKMIITDFNMPRMDGFELVQHMRRKYDKSDLIMIGLSSETDGTLSAKFIKNGANDFLRKPFNHEEFFCRVSHNMDFMEMFEALKDSANRDDHTGAYKLSHFNVQGDEMFERALASGTPLACAVIDLDDLSEIINEYGPEAGDVVMEQVSSFLVSSFERFLLARAGTELFYALMPGLDNAKATAFVERVRQIVGGKFIDLGGAEVSLSFSAGVSNVMGNNLSELVEHAHQSLLRARDAGGDLVIGDD